MCRLWLENWKGLLMAIRKIVLYSENPKVLRKKSRPVERVDRDVKRLIQHLKDTLNAHADGIGLAAPQVNVHQQIVIVRLGASGDGSGEPDPPIALINPEVVEAGEARKDFDGCLSFPDLYGKTTRPHYLRVVGLDENGKTFDQVYEGFDAVVVHHEIDHLDGTLFIDRIENPEDLYWFQTNAQGELVRVSAASDMTTQGHS
jgi:peptide deformylase